MGCLHALSPGSAEAQISHLFTCDRLNMGSADAVFSVLRSRKPTLGCPRVTQRPELVLFCCR